MAMKQKIKILLSSLALVVGMLGLFAPVPVSAANEPGEGGDSTACGTDGVDVGAVAEGDCAEKTAFKFGNCGRTGVTISCMATEIMRFLTALVGILVVAGITVGGIVYSTGSGNPAKTQKGVTIIVNSILGLVTYALMFAIINFLIPGGIFK